MALEQQEKPLSRRARELFEAAILHPEAQRGAFLERACAGDAQLLRAARALLYVDDDPQSGGVTREQAGGDIKHTEIGGFRIVRRIGAGGMGVVYEAVQQQPRRTVALKIMRPNPGMPALASRFSTEAETLARLNHPAIASLYGMGVHRQPDGTELPYFAMEYIAGAKSITAYAAAKPLDLPARLGLFLTVCEAVHYAHMRGVIHRDLKPENILVDASGWPRVIDFGVVKLTNSDVHTTLATAAGEIVGTLQYMSPEQCDGDPHVLDLRSDIYSLGVILYELVCRRTPYDVAGKRLVDAIQMIRTHDPVPPGKIHPGLAGDLDAIILRAMERDPDRRYQSVHGLGLDLKRYLGGEPVHARANSATYTLRKVLWRWRREALLVFFSITVILLSLSRIVGQFSGLAAAILAGAPIIVLVLSALSVRTAASMAGRARKELAEVRGELNSVKAMHRASEVECRGLRDRLDVAQVRTSEAIGDLIREAQGLGAGPEVRETINRAAKRILSAGDKERRTDV